MEQIEMGDGLTFSVEARTSTKVISSPSRGWHWVTIYQATSISGGPAGYVGFGRDEEEAIMDAYRKIYKDQQ